MFEIRNFLPVKGKSINIREENHGEEKVKCVDWRVVAEVTNEWLATLDSALKPMFWRPVIDTDAEADAPQLDDIALAMPVLRNVHLKYPVPLAYEFFGFQLTVDRGMGGTSNIVLLDCKVNAFTLDCKEGGTAILSFRIQATNVSTEVRGKLSDYIKGAVTAIALKPPQERQEAIDGTKGHPGATAAPAAPAAAPATPATGHEAGDTLAANEAAGLNKPASEVPAPKPAKKRASGKPSLKVVEPA